jgi:predicted nucleic acid-binding protein
VALSPPQHERGLLDTSAIIVFGQQAVPWPTVVHVSAVTLAELAVGPHSARTPDERARRLERLQMVERDFAALPFDADAARAFGAVGAALRAAGRTARSRTLDAMIAATALAHGLPVYTCNPSDFGGIPGLEVVAVPSA